MFVLQYVRCDAIGRKVSCEHIRPNSKSVAIYDKETSPFVFRINNSNDGELATWSDIESAVCLLFAVREQLSRLCLVCIVQ